MNYYIVVRKLLQVFSLIGVMLIVVYFALRKQDYVKFVIADEKDYEFVRNWITKLPVTLHIVLQPVWGKDLKWLAEKVLADDLQVRVLTQFHKLIWGEIPGV